MSSLQLPLRLWGRKWPTGHPSEAGTQAECCGSLCGPTLRPTQAPLSQDEGPGLQRPSGMLDGGTRVPQAAWSWAGRGPRSFVHIPVASLSTGLSQSNGGELSVIQIRTMTSSPSGHQQHTARASRPEASAKSCTSLKRLRNSEFWGVCLPCSAVSGFLG